MSIAPFTYNLPKERIAERPIHPYDAAKLLVINRAAKNLKDSVFSNLTDQLTSNDLLIFNNTKVIPARLYGSFSDTGGKIEFLLIKQNSEQSWLALAKPQKKCLPNREIIFSEGLLGKIINNNEDSLEIEFNFSKSELDKKLAKVGTMPIPPYIRGGKSDEEDRADYQTFFAEHKGSIAAPTASLHFTPELKESIKAKGAQLEYLTLHVGLASFLPLWQEDSTEIKKPAKEEFFISDTVRSRIKDHKKNSGRVIAVGTTVVRALESMDLDSNATELFITPGYKYKYLDALITNFHQPATTHLLLVEALLGKKLLTDAYQHALENNYRFLSYGDGMLIS